MPVSSFRLFCQRELTRDRTGALRQYLTFLDLSFSPSRQVRTFAVQMQEYGCRAHGRSEAEAEAASGGEESR